MSTQLSFCIPTFNRAFLLGYTIESIINQANDEVEIVISDNASEDNTEEIVKSYQKIFSKITYFRQERNLGFDKNLLNAVKLAQGEYCWLMGSDDVIRPGAINRMLKELKEGFDIYLCNRTWCSFELVPIVDNFWLSKRIPDRCFNLSNKNELNCYLNSSMSLGALFGFMSSDVFKREKWNNVNFNESFLGTAYSHVYMLLSFIKKGSCRLKYIKESLVFCRGFNDSFGGHGQVKRFELDIDGHSLLAEEFFSEDVNLQNMFLKVITRMYPWQFVATVRTNCENINKWLMLEKKLKSVGYPGYMLFIYRYTKLVILMARFIKAKFKRIYYPLLFSYKEQAK